MKILALDTATENCSAALLIDGHIHAREIEVERGHAERILPMVDDLLAEAHVSLADLDAIAFGRGPGSFTGVRLAATVTQGLAFGANLGVVPISDLRAVAQRAFALTAATAGAPSRVLVCNDARMSEVYWACFELDQSSGLAKLHGEERVSKPADTRLPPDWSPTTTLRAGRGFKAYAATLEAALTGISEPTRDGALGPAPGSAAETAIPTLDARIPLAELLPRATEIALLSIPEVTAGRLHPPEAATPVYLRDNVAHVAQPLKPSR